MLLYVYDKSFGLLGVVDRYTSLIWTREYNQIGTFQLHTIIDDALSILRKGNIVIKENNPYDAMEIVSISMNDGEVDTLQINGVSISNFLNQRIVWGMQTQTGTIESVLKGFVNTNCVSPTDVNRQIPNLGLSVSAGITTPATEVSSYDILLELVKELAVKYDVGWRIIFDVPNQKYWFDVYQGTDSSVNQSVNPQVIFSSEYDNVLDQTFTDNDTSFKNTALIGGQGEGPDRKLVSLNNANSGFERREVFIDADDIPKTNEAGAALTDPEYTQLLTERGLSKLSQLKPMETFEAGVSVLSNFIYGQDFDLGDIVTIQNTTWGVTINTRITSIEEVYEGNNTDVRVNFGSKIPTLIDKLNKAVNR